MFKITTQIKFKNGMLFEAMQKAKCKNQRDFARYLGVSQTEIGRMLNFKWNPINISILRTKKKWMEIEKKICELTGYLLEDIFPKELVQADLARKKNVINITNQVDLELLSSKNINLLTTPTPEDEAMEKEDESILENALSSLTIRERKVIKLGFGFHDGKEWSFKEIAKVYNLSSERIREINCKALKKLRHPIISNTLKPLCIN